MMTQFFLILSHTAEMQQLLKEYLNTNNKYVETPNGDCIQLQSSEFQHYLLLHY